MSDRIYPGDPRYDGFRVTALFAFLQVDPADDQEGSPTMSFGPGVVGPMMGTDTRRIEDLYPLAQEYARATGRRIRVVRSTGLEEVKVFEPLECAECHDLILTGESEIEEIGDQLFHGPCYAAKLDRERS